MYSKVNQLYILRIYIFFCRFFSLIGYHKILILLPVLYSRSLLVIYFTYSMNKL